MRSITAAALILGAWTAPSAADVVVTTLDEAPPVRGISLVVDRKTVTVQSAQGGAKSLDTARVIQIAAAPTPAAPAPAARPFEVVLVDGSRLRGVLEAAGNGNLRLRSPVLDDQGGAKEILLDDVLEVRRVAGAEVPGASRLVRLPDADAAYRLSGARVQGTVRALTATGLVMARAGELGDITVAYDDLAAIFVENEALPAPEGLHAVLHAADGSAILLKTFRVAGGNVTGTTPVGVEVRVPSKHLAALRFQGGSFVHLSDLPAADVRRDPFFPIPEGPGAAAMLDFVCPVRLDASPDGRTITLQREPYFKGIGVRPRTRLTWTLDGAFREFTATCGIDDEVLGPGYGRGAGTGSVIFAVEVDGKRVYESPAVMGGRPPEQVRVPLAGAKTLTLVVDLVPAAKMPQGVADTPELDNAVWARPLLVR